MFMDPYVCNYVFFLSTEWNHQEVGVDCAFLSLSLLQADTNLEECPVWAAVPFLLHLEKGSSLCGEPAVLICRLLPSLFKVSFYLLLGL